MPIQNSEAIRHRHAISPFPHLEAQPRPKTTSSLVIHDAPGLVPAVVVRRRRDPAVAVGCRLGRLEDGNLVKLDNRLVAALDRVVVVALGATRRVLVHVVDTSAGGPRFLARDDTDAAQPNLGEALEAGDAGGDDAARWARRQLLSLFAMADQRTRGGIGSGT